MSTGSVFAGLVMHRTGKYKLLNLTFGIFPFIATILIRKMRVDSGPLQLWLSIVRLRCAYNNMHPLKCAIDSARVRERRGASDYAHRPSRPPAR